MDIFFVVTGMLLSLAQTIPYAVGVVKGQARPNIVSWFTWALLTAIGSVAAWAEGDWHAALVISANCLGTLAIVVLGLKFGYAKLTKLDIFSQIVAFFGLSLWPLLHDSLLTVFLVLGVDILAWLLTVRHAFYKPYEEVWVTYAFAMVGSLFGLLSLQTFTVKSMIYLLYLVMADGLMFLLILYRRKRLTQEAARE